jgi:hypothetical protein
LAACGVGKGDVIDALVPTKASLVRFALKV